MYMKNNNQEHCEKLIGNGDIPQILLLIINRYQDIGGKVNNLQIQFSDTITVPNAEKINIQYTLAGYVLFKGNTEEGHYRVIIKGKDNRWFLYNDAEVKELTEFERNNHHYKGEVMLLGIYLYSPLWSPCPPMSPFLCNSILFQK